MAYSFTCAPTKSVKTKAFEVDGVAAYFNQAVPCVVAADGTCIIASTTDFEITSITPASAVENSYQAHGLMENPGFLSEQGFDAIAGQNYTSVAAFPWNASLNKDPGYTAASISITAGTNTSFLKAVRKTGITGPNQIATIERYVPISIVDELPAFGAFRPGVSHTVKTCYTGANQNILRSLSLPVGGTSLADCVSGNYLRRALPLFGYGFNQAELLRRLQTDTSDYSANFGITRGKALLGLHSNSGDKTAYFNRAVQHGIDVYSSYLAGFPGGSGAGQHHGYVGFLYFAAFALGDAAMLAAAQDLQSNMTSQSFTITSDYVGLSAGWPTNPGDSNEQRYRATYFAEQVGDPGWNVFGTEGDYRQAYQDAGMQSRYRNVGDGAMLAELLPVLLLQNGPGGITGYEAVEGAVGGDAAIDYLDQLVTMTPKTYSGASWDDALRDTYLSWRASVARPRWTGRPLQIPNTGHITAGSGSFSWDFLSVGYASETVTRKDIRYSVDQRSWMETQGVADTGTVSSLMSGVKHYVQLRQVSASGAGIWSHNRPAFSGDEQNTAVTTGTPAAAIPVNVVAPKIVYRPYPTWKGEWYEDCPATVPDEVGRLYAGVGYHTGYPGPTYTFQWKRGGVDIAGATNSYYDRGVADAGATLTVAVTATNASGSVTTTSAGVACAATQPKTAYHVPAGTLGALPNGFTSRWNATAFTLDYDDGKDQTIDCLKMGGGSGSTATNLFYSLDTLAPLGSLADVPEGEIVILTEYGGSGNYTQANGVVFRATGADAASATGYIVELRYTASTTANLTITRVSGGTRSTAATQSITTASPANGKSRLRVNWSLSGTDLLIRARAWAEPTDTPQLGPDEPASWQVTYTDTSPLASGRLGLGNVQSRSPRRIIGMGVSTDPTVTAPLNGNV